MASNNSVTITLSARDEASKVIQGLRGSLTAATAAGNILANTITSGVSKAFEGLTSSIKSAAEAELGTIMAAGSYARITGVSFSQATEEVNNLTKALATQAGALPGVTEDYVAIGKGIYDDLIPAYKELKGTFDSGSFKTYATDVISRIGVLQAASGESVTNVNKVIGKLLSGKSTLAELSSYDWFVGSGLARNIEDQLVKMGKDGADLKGMAQDEILKMLGTSLEDLVSDDLIKAASNSIDGMWQGFMSSMFDKNTGLFGIMRDLDEKTKGDQSVFSNLKRVLSKIIGPDGIFTKLGNIMRDSGMGEDPMAVLASGLGKLGKFLDKVNKALSNIDSLNIDNLGQLLAEFINRVIDPSKAGQISLDILGLLGKIVKAFFENLGAALINLDTVSVAVIAGGILTNLFVIPWITKFATKMLAQASIATLGPIALLAVAAGLVIINLVKVIVENWDQIKAGLISTFKGGVAVIKGAAEGIFTVISGIITGDWSVMETGFRQIGDAAKKVIDGVKGVINTILGQLPGAQQANLDEAAKKAEDKYNQAYFNKYGVGPDSAYGLPNAATGMNYGGLLAAASREAKQSPSGSSLVVANSSEAILNKGQQAQLLNSIGNRGGVTIGNITVNSNASDPREVAKEVIRTLNQEFAKYTATTRSVPV